MFFYFFLLLTLRFFLLTFVSLLASFTTDSGFPLEIVFFFSSVWGIGVHWKIVIPIGGIVIKIEYSRSCIGIDFACFTLGFVLPAPPKATLSLLNTSLYLPANGTPTRYSLYAFGVKLQAMSSICPCSDFLKKK